MPKIPETDVAQNGEKVPDPQSTDVAEKAHEMLEMLNDSPHQPATVDTADSQD